VYQTYSHPKEALITDGIVNREINRAAGKGNIDENKIPRELQRERKNNSHKIQ